MRNILVTILFLISLAGISKTVYIDPSTTNPVQNGTIGNPYDSWGDFTIQNGNAYLQKVNTTYTSSTQLFLSGKNAVIIGSYGKGIRPKFNYTGSGYAVRIEASDYCTIQNFEINGNGNAHSLVAVIGTSSRYQNGITFEHCVLHNAHNPNNAGFGVYASYVNGLSVQQTSIRNVALDGMYLANCINADIGYCTVHNINKRYFLNPDQKYSSGDGIQFDGNYNGFYLHHTIVARTNGAGNKFGIIFNSAPGTSDNATGVIEYCEFQTDGNVSCAVHIERGNWIIVRYNTFLGTTQGLRIAGKFSNNTQVYGNTFQNCDRGIGVGATWVSGIGYPATGTKIYNNTFTNTGRYQIWIDRSQIEVCNNSGDGLPIFNYGGGSVITMANCE
jgi:hypothetical protein